MNEERVRREFDLLRNCFPDAEYLAEHHFVHLPGYPLPPGVWQRTTTNAGFFVPESYPGQSPYPFFVRPDLLLPDGSRPNNYAYPAQIPVAGTWGSFSWVLDDWRASDEITQGSNLLAYARSLAQRFREGR